jgi:hypothetical protein
MTAGQLIWRSLVCFRATHSAALAGRCARRMQLVGGKLVEEEGKEMTNGK